MHPELVRTADRQGGVFTREQALSAYSPAEIRSHLRRRRWRPTPWRGVFVDGELPDRPELLVRAASLWLGGDLVACHSTAALLWDFDLRGDEEVRGDALHFLGPVDLGNRRLSRLQVHPSSLGTDDAVLHRGVWCTPPARTACDVVRLGAPIDGLATLDAALRSGTCDRGALADACARQRGLRGVVRLGRLIPFADAGAESPMESRMRWRFLAGGLPAPRVQVEVTDGSRRHRLDVGWEDALVGAEFDGLEAHMTRQQLTADRDRHNWLTERSWRLLHFTATDVYRQHERMVATVARHLGNPRRTIMVL
jgi:very-short-patch-repair endonuclease